MSIKLNIITVTAFMGVHFCVCVGLFISVCLCVCVRVTEEKEERQCERGEVYGACISCKLIWICFGAGCQRMTINK